MIRHSGSATKDKKRNPTHFILWFCTEPQIYFEDSASKWAVDAANTYARDRLINFYPINLEAFIALLS